MTPNGLEIVRSSWNQFEMILAEKEGFEPSIRQKPYTGFRVQRIRPLCHFSGYLAQCERSIELIESLKI